MHSARCTCGAIALSLPEPSRLVVACHCLDCQRRTGAPFGVAVGAIADPTYPAPARSVFEQSKHGWVEIAAVEHFPQGSIARR
jgi:hypothetical protein